jgi:hypothetical protein
MYCTNPASAILAEEEFNMATLKYERLAIVPLDALLAGGLEIVQHY